MAAARIVHAGGGKLEAMLSREQWRWLLRGVLVLAGICAVILFFLSGAQHHLNLEALQRSREWLSVEQGTHPWRLAFAFMGVLIAIVVLSLPLLTVMTLAAGAIFGVIEGTVLMSFGSAIGATLVMLASRFVFKDAIRRRFAHRLHKIDAGIERDGAFYLLNIRLVPIFPFFLVNLLMGVTHMPVRTYYWVTQLGMLAGTAVYVNAGTRIAEARSPEQLISLPLIVSLALLAVLPWASRWIIRRLRHWRHQRRWRR
ncbi:MAG TPA: TVP38/TMEM64 family protein [Rhodanobacteraceae bacterium]|nr:TVP38/TMEM64 family protein [Rhodanobacteraceae bacterium]